MSCGEILNGVHREMEEQRDWMTSKGFSLYTFITQLQGNIDVYCKDNIDKKHCMVLVDVKLSLCFITCIGDFILRTESK